MWIKNVILVIAQVDVVFGHQIKNFTNIIQF